MLRQLFLYLSTQAWAYRLILSNALTRSLAWRFVAGETLDEALVVVRQLNARGIRVTLDHLGENVSSAVEAIRATDEAVRALEGIAATGVESHLSIKLTQLGLDLGDDFCRAQLERIVEEAERRGTFVRVDMEGSVYTDRTLALVATMRETHDAATVGTVLQAYLYRTKADLAELIAAGTRVRLVKGAYNEPPDLAYPRKADVDRAYQIGMEQLLAQAGYPALATHDERLIAHARQFASAEGIDPARFEFQMLYGVRRDLQEQLAREGFNVRCYVPYGKQWYPYFMRRLAERPANVLFIARNLFRREA